MSREGDRVAPALMGRGGAFHRRQRPGVPRGIAARERRRGGAVRDDAERDRDGERDDELRSVREIGRLDDDHAEHDRREAAWTEPSEVRPPPVECGVADEADQDDRR